MSVSRRTLLGTYGPIAGLALGGMMLAHQVGYALTGHATGSPAERLATPVVHGGFFSFLALAAVLLVAGTLAVRGGRALQAPQRRQRFEGATLFLLALQMPAFLLLELSERHLALGATLHDRAVVVGLLIQVFTALLVAAILALVERAAVGAAAAASAADASADPERPMLRLTRPSVRMRQFLATTSIQARAPPGLLAID